MKGITEHIKPSQSQYLVRAYSSSKNSLYSHTVFRVIADYQKKENKICKVLDLGCADGRARELLVNYGLEISDYCGVDYNRSFNPMIVDDIRNVDNYLKKVPFSPNVVLITDVLEHLEKGRIDIDIFLHDLKSRLPKDCIVYTTAPQMYRLDRFKLSYLHYPEHTVRMSLAEWKEIISKHISIEQTLGAGYVSVLPYLLMFLPNYKEDKILGKIFKKVRSLISAQKSLYEVDYYLSKTLGKREAFVDLANSVVLVCKNKERGHARYEL